MDVATPFPRHFQVVFDVASCLLNLSINNLVHLNAFNHTMNNGIVMLGDFTSSLSAFTFMPPVTRTMVSL